jgi:hypothetical protein
MGDASLAAHKHAGCWIDAAMAVREQLHQRFRGLETPECPFANLPETRAGRLVEGLTAERMKNCRWLKPVLVAQFEFVEWTPEILSGTPDLSH